MPARPTFAIGDAYFKILDQDEYERTTSELRQSAHHDWREIEKRLGHVA